MSATLPDSYLVTAQQTLSVARQAGVDVALSGVAMLTFCKAVVDRLDELCRLQDAPWLSPLHHPYATASIVKQGAFEGLSVTVLVPPMGASPMACTIEDLVACGVKLLFLVCGAWSLGPPVEFGDLVVPAFSVGTDGTSLHYGNASGCVSADPVVAEALAAAVHEGGAMAHVGGNASCEALYRISPQMVKTFRQRGCLCMDNGEASTLFAATRALGVLGGVLFQPYIDLGRGWDPAWLRDDRYRATCRLQAEVVLQAGIDLGERLDNLSP